MTSKRVIFIASTSFSGSTLIDLTLANDPTGFSCGEISYKYHPEQAHHLAPRCACGSPTCRVWSNLSNVPEADLYRTIFDQHPDIDFAIDSSKDPFWIARQQRYLAAAGIESDVVLIWKDPFEIATSFHNRHRLDKWKRHWLNYHRLLISQIDGNFIAVSYRDYATRPDTLAEICVRLKIPYFRGKEQYWTCRHHSLFGNLSARRHLNAVEAAVQGSGYIDGQKLRSIYYHKPDNPDVIDHVNRHMLAEPLIEKMHEFLIAKSNSDDISSVDLGMTIGQVTKRRFRRLVPRVAVLKGRLRKMVQLSPKPLQKPDQSKRQIAFVLPGHLSSVNGGAEYQANLIMAELKLETDAEITYFCRRADLGFQSTSHRVSVLPKIPVLARYAYFIDVPFLYFRLRRLNPTLIYNRDIGAYTAACAFYAKRRGIKFVIHLAHDKDVTPLQPPYTRNFLKRIDKRFLEYGLKRADIIVAQTTQQVALLKANYGLDVAIIQPNVFQTPKTLKPIPQKSPPQVLWVANFKDFKQPHLFVELAKRLADTNAEFVMVGLSGPKDHHLIKTISIQKNLRYLGPLSHDDVLKLFGTASIFVNTSSAEGFPNTFLQAWMHQVPVVSLHVNPNDALTGQIGFCAGDMDTMEHDIRRILGSSDLQMTLGLAAQKYASSRFGLSALGPLMKVLRD